MIVVTDMTIAGTGWMIVENDTRTIVVLRGVVPVALRIVTAAGVLLPIATGVEPRLLPEGVTAAVTSEPMGALVMST